MCRQHISELLINADQQWNKPCRQTEVVVRPHFSIMATMLPSGSADQINSYPVNLVSLNIGSIFHLGHVLID